LEKDYACSTSTPYSGRYRRKIANLKEKIADGADFAGIAKQRSNCPSGSQGGDLDEFGPGQMLRELDGVIFSGEANVVHGHVKTQFSYHLLKITSHTD